MKKTGILTDSHSGITQEEAKKLGIYVLPMPFYINDQCHYEGKDISREEFIELLKNDENVSTSQPSPEAVMNLWDEILKEYEELVYIPISSGLSGSCSTAMAMAQNDDYDGKVFVVDNGRVSTPMKQSVLDAIELLNEGCSAKEIKNRLEDAKGKMGIFVAVDDLKYLKKGGRISSSVALVGGMLKVKPILKFDIGTLDSFKNCRGLIKAKTVMIEEVKRIVTTDYAEDFEKGNVHILAASSADEEETKKWVNEIQEAFPGIKVLWDYLPMGITCHIGPGGLGIGYSVRP
ncbi:DegV family protein [Eubacterium sp. AF19-12LB]|uniref:DegV family protein n=2 Tax=Eubacteriaceae TaxID=186806 RepID=A0ABT2M0N9_9FIRM|nr:MULTISPECIES: DegV family protein [unclassified Eubacterium (in: firmicutes)]MCT7399090.1 DegV family protein [Eubacterium sp. LFL-14]RHR34608.1 DegV family protein [Eubacterium sp. AF19-12LB]